MRFKVYDFEIVNLNSQTSQNNELIEYVNEYEVSNDIQNTMRIMIEDFTSNYGYDSIFDNLLYPINNEIVLKIKEYQHNISLWNTFENLLFIFPCITRDINQKENKIPDNVLIIFLTIFDISNCANN